MASIARPAQRLARLARTISTCQPRPRAVARPQRTGSAREFATSCMRPAPKTVEGVRSRHRTGPVSIYSGIFFILCGGGAWWYFQSEKARMQRQKTREQTKGYGKPKVGGDFDLVDQYGRRFTSDDMKGKFALIYFGFTHCPDICPDELDKMAQMIDIIAAKRGNVFLPVVITCDPARDTPPVLAQYLEEFHPKMIGLTGPWENIRDVCKKYRVYFSTPPHVRPGQDYLVDHSIYFYLMDPEGDFIEVIGREHTAERGAKLVTDHIGDWQGPLDRS